MVFSLQSFVYLRRRLRMHGSRVFDEASEFLRQERQRTAQRRMKLLQRQVSARGRSAISH